MKSLAMGLALILLVVGADRVAGEEPSPPVVDGAGEGGLMNRIDFGNAYVTGQSIKSGAVYLLNRKSSEIQSMLRERRDFRREIREDAETVDPSSRPVAPPRAAAEK